MYALIGYPQKIPDLLMLAPVQLKKIHFCFTNSNLFISYSPFENDDKFTTNSLTCRVFFKKIYNKFFDM